MARVDETSSTSTLSLGNFVAGAAVGGALVFAAMRGRASSAAASELAGQLSTLRSEILQQTASVETRLSARVATQEHTIAAAVSTRLSDLQARLAVMDSANSSLSKLTDQVSEINSLWARPQARGAFGEFQLEALVRDVLPPNAFALQSALRGGQQPDCVLLLPAPHGKLAIDAKFPLDAFRELCVADVAGAPATATRAARGAARKKLTDHLRGHVRAVADKYIVPGETADAALLFLPSEAVYAELHEHHRDVVEEAHRLRVFIASPTTLMALVVTVRAVLKDATVHRRADAILSEVAALVADVDRLCSRSAAVEKHFEKAREDLRLLGVSADKIRRRGLRVTEIEAGGDDEGERLGEGGGARPSYVASYVTSGAGAADSR